MSVGQLNEVRTKGTQRWRLTREFYVNPGYDIILHAAYEWVIRLSNGEVQIDRCTSDPCNNIFMVTRGGSKQKYCSNTCKVRAFRRREGKKETS